METILVERDAGVVTVTLNRPEKRNAINTQMWLELRDALREIEANRDDRVLVVTGAGNAFCSGADLTDPDPEQLAGLPFMRRVGSVALALHHVTKPTVAKVRGVAAGAGWNLALGCDLVVVAESARFSQIFVHRGLVLDFGGSWILPRLIGMQRAKELTFFGDFVSAADAYALGLVNRVLADDEVDGFVADWAARLAAGPPLALSMTKTLLNEGIESSLEQALEDEARCQALCFTTADTREAVDAFVEKRAPVFRGE